MKDNFLAQLVSLQGEVPQLDLLFVNREALVGDMFGVVLGRSQVKSGRESAKLLFWIFRGWTLNYSGHWQTGPLGVSLEGQRGPRRLDTPQEGSLGGTGVGCLHVP